MIINGFYSEVVYREIGGRKNTLNIAPYNKDNECHNVLNCFATAT